MEYDQVITVEEGTLQLPEGHEYIELDPNANNVDTLAFRLCREMTLARGRILYNIVFSYGYDTYIAGYFVPAPIAAEARSRAACAWNLLPHTERTALQANFTTLRHRFPRLPETDARKIAEVALSYREVLHRSEIEKLVAAHAVCKWTGYEVLRTGGMGEREAWCAVRGRMREVLERWCEEGTGTTELAGLFERVGVLDEGEGEGEGHGVWFQRFAGLRWFGGGESVANLVTVGHGRV